MKKCRPTKWILPALAGVALPLLAAGWINSGGVVNDIASRAGANLTSNEALSWAKLDFDGRDATVSGTTTSQQAVDEAVKAVAGTYGVRTVAAKGVQIVELLAPTVESADFETLTPEIRGTWPEGTAKSLDVAVDSTTFTLPGSPELTSAGGNWVLKLTAPLAAGEHTVTATAHDGPYASKAAEAPGKITVTPPDVTGPALATVAPAAAGAVWPYAISGTYDAADTSKLTATLAGQEYVMGTSPELTTDGKGAFTFAPTVSLTPGSYDIDVSTFDAKGNVSTAKAVATVVIPEPAPAEPAGEDLAVPTLAPVPQGAAWPYPITGTYDAKDTVKLTADLAGREYVANTDAELVAKPDGTFVFTPGVSLTPGTYDIGMTAFNKAGEAVKTTLPAAIVIAEGDATAPAAPTVPTVTAGAAWPYPLTGTFDSKDTAKLTASVQGREYVANQDAALTTNGDTYTFAPTDTFAPGTYDVDLTATDKAGNAVKVTAAAAIVVAAAPAPVIIPAPTVTRQLDLTGAPIVKGTFAGADALKIELGGKSYELGKSANLAVDDKGNWRLMPSAALADGTYDVVVTASKGEASAKDETLGELTVEATMPAVPTVNPVSTAEEPRTFTGTYDAKRSTGLSVSVTKLLLKGELGQPDTPLTVDGDGNWTLTVPANIHPQPSVYDIVVTATDKHGRTVVDASNDEIAIAAANQPVPPLPPPYDCAAVMDRIHAVFPMRFIYARVDFAERFGLSVDQYASLLKDPRCATLRVEVGGHADDRGTTEYNLGLAQRRANKVRDMLVTAGVDQSRLVVKSYGESVPLESGETEAAWSKNRRVEINVIK